VTEYHFIIRNLFRNARRTLLTAGSVAISILLLVILGATYRYLNAPPGVDRFSLTLVVMPRTSLMVPMPMSYRDRIARLRGVEAVTPLNWFDGHYGPENTSLPAFACDPDVVLRIFDWQMPEDQRRAFVKERMALLAGQSVAQKYGWRIGDHIHLSSPNYRVSLDLVLRGIYRSADDETSLAFHWDYLNEALGKPNTPGAFWVLAHRREDVPRLTTEIDALFRNQEVETRTQTMKQFVLSFLAMLGNVKLILLSISAAAVFAILLVVANTMAMSVRERTSELAVIRALGFRTQQVLSLLTAESLALSLVGAGVGSGAAWMLLRLIRGYRIGGMMPIFIQVDLATLLLAFVVAVAIGLSSTFVPAYRASRLNIAQALRFVG